MPEYNEIINVIVRWSEQGKEIAKSIKKSLAGSKKDMEEWNRAGQKVAKGQVNSFEYAGGQLRKVSKDYAVPLTKSGKVIEKGMTQIGETSKTVQPNVKQITTDLEQTRSAITRTSTIWTQVGGKWVRTGQIMAKSARSFRMEYLSIMFIGMHLQKMFGGMMSGVLETAGIFEFFSAVLQDVLWPVLGPIIDLLYDFGEWLMDLPDWAKIGIGALVLIGFVLGTLMMVMGTLSIVSIPTLVGAFIGGFSAIGAAMMANPIILIIVAIIAAIILLYLAWKNNWFGIRDVLTAVGKAIADAIRWVIDTVVGIFKWFFEFFSALWSGNWGKAVDMLKTALTNIWNSVVSIFNSIKNTISSILNSIWTFISGIWNNIRNTISNFLGAIWSNIASAWNNIKNTISNVLNAIWNTITSTFSNIVKGIYNWGSSFVNNLVKGITDIGWKIAEALWNLIPEPFKSALRYGTSIVGGIAKAIGGAAKTIGGWLGLQAGGIITAPTFALIGEREREAVIPLSKLEGFGTTIVYQPSISIDASITEEIDINHMMSKVDDYIVGKLKAMVGL